jgi:methionyl-tRNA synthetase
LDTSKLTEADRAFLKKCYEQLGNYVTAFENVEIKDALKIALDVSHEGNKYIQDNQPWEKQNADSKR